MGRPPTITRERVIDTARRVFAAKGFAATTLADIAGELGVTPAAILRHVDSKQALFGLAMESGMLLDPPACILELPKVDAKSDPRIVLRRIAEGFVPFIQDVLATRIVVAMHAKARSTSVVLPFDPEADNPPRRGLKIVADYFRRAAKAGVMRISDPQAAALLFMGSLQGYVLSQAVLKITPALPLNQYIDALLELWSGGVILSSKRGGSRAIKGNVSPNRPRAPGARARGDRPAAVHARSAKAEAGGPERVARSANRAGRVAGRRTRRPRSDR
jgi:AcrR family transcriptional regulator